MFSALFLVFMLLLAGHLARRWHRFPDNAADVLNRFIIDVCLPATILRVVPTLRFDPSLLALVVTPWAMAAVSYCVSRIVGSWLSLDRKTAAAFFITTSLGNTSFLGFPLCSALLGEESLPLAAVYDQVGSFLLVSVVAPIAIGNATSVIRPRPREVALKVVSFPPFLALVVALLPIPWPTFIAPLLASASAPLVPLAMFAVGFKLPLARPERPLLMSLALGTKLVLLPLLSLGFVAVLDVPPLVRQVAVLETAMPTMITAGAILMGAGIAVEFVAAIVGWGLILSLITVPLWSLVLR